ncbi:MAG: D-alanyl-D-alanine carboxypeptidase [Clostridia bacterium]|nr:D-alanyl-D-alanine carboxypeptidase [Clostridia bacterium]
MVKKTICVLISVIITVLSFSTAAYAYEPTGIDITAESCLLASLDTDEVLYSKNENKKMFPASITKIMTVILMLESKDYDPNKKIAMTDEVLKLISGTGSSVSNLKSGEEITELDLAYLVLMASFGDCAYLLAIKFGGSVDDFVKMMNDRARELGMKDTHYENPVGLHHAQNYTTAADTLILTKYALKNETFKKICESPRYTMAATNMSRERTFSTTNFLQDTTTNYYYAYAKGVKTGYTDEAGRCLVSTASYNGYNYICIMFKCPVDPGRRHEFYDSKNLYKWAFNNFEFKKIADLKNPVCEVGVALSPDIDTIPLFIDKSIVTVLPKNADESTVTIVPHTTKKTFDAPIKKGQVMGTADVYYAERKIGTVKLISGQNVKRSNLIYVFTLIKGFFLSKYMIMVYILLGVIILFFIISIIRLNVGRKKKRKVRYIPYKGDDKE